MMIRGLSSSSMMPPMCSMMAGTLSASMGEGSSRSASTSPSKPGIGGGEHAVSLALVTLDPLLPAAGDHPEAVDQDDGVWSVGCVGGILGGHGSAASFWMEGGARQPRLGLINEGSLPLPEGGVCAPEHQVRQGTK
jgi:hypothetical protein